MRHNPTNTVDALDSSREIALRRERGYEFLFVLRGIMISRRPKRRKSSENSPGPTNATEIPTPATIPAAKGPCNRCSDAAGKIESATLRTAAATVTLKIGV